MPSILDLLKAKQDERDSSVSGFLGQLGTGFRMAAGGDSMQREQERLQSRDQAIGMLQALSASPTIQGLNQEQQLGLVNQALSGNSQGLQQSFNLLKDLQNMQQKQNTLGGITQGVQNLLQNSGKQLQPSDVQLINDVLTSDPRAALNLANSALGRARSEGEKKLSAKESLLQEQIRQAAPQAALQQTLSSLPADIDLTDPEALKKLGVPADQRLKIINAIQNAPKDPNSGFLGFFQQPDIKAAVESLKTEQQGPSQAELQNELLKVKSKKAGERFSPKSQTAAAPVQPTTITLVDPKSGATKVVTDTPANRKLAKDRGLSIAK